MRFRFALLLFCVITGNSGAQDLADWQANFGVVSHSSSEASQMLFRVRFDRCSDGLDTAATNLNVTVRDANGVIGEFDRAVRFDRFTVVVTSGIQVAPGLGDLFVDGTKIGRIAIDSTGRMQYSLEGRLSRRGENLRTGDLLMIPRSAEVLFSFAIFDKESGNTLAVSTPPTTNSNCIVSD